MAKMGRPRRDEQAKKKVVIAAPVRTGGRVKKAKVVFDPSYTVSSSSTYRKRNTDRSGDGSDSSSLDQSRSDKKQRKDSESSAKVRDDIVCTECSRVEFKKCKQIFSCLDCNYKAHPICLKIQYEDVNLLKSNFRCDECKTCSACYDGTDEGPLVTCGKCTNSYHYGCHVPKIILKFIDINKWFCTKCSVKKISTTEIRKTETLPIKKSTTEIRKTETLPIKKSTVAVSVEKQPVPVCSVQLKEKSDTDEDLITIKDEDIQLKNSPNVTEWSSAEVTEFFKPHFPEHSHIFEENEIDGLAILSMKRSDIVGKMSLKLGPSLKMYNLVLELQTGCKDITQSWSQ